MTPRQLDVLLRICDGKSSKAIARELGIAPATVKVHTRALLEEWHVENRTELAVRALERWGTFHNNRMRFGGATAQYGQWTVTYGGA